MRIEALSGWTSEQRHVVAATFLGWALDAFDFFLLVFVQEHRTRLRHSHRRRDFRHHLDLGDASKGGPVVGDFYCAGCAAAEI